MPVRKVALPDDGVETFFGTHDENLRHLETLFGVEIRTDGHGLLVEGDGAGAERVDRFVGQVAGLMKDGYKFAPGEVKTAASLIAEDPAVDLRDYFLRSTIRGSTKKQVVPKSGHQRAYLDAIEKHDVVFGVGPAGTGKTYLAMAQAVAFLLAKRVSRIILARPAVEAGEKLGFLPGDLQAKVNPYLRPLYDALYDMMEQERAERLIERGTIEIAPIAFMRGRTLNDAFVILDEAQNTTSEQMKMFLTRLGFGSKAVITGDITQIDLPTGRVSGLIEALNVVRQIEGIAFIHFDERDVVRHKLVQRIVQAYAQFTAGGAIPPAAPTSRMATGAAPRLVVTVCDAAGRPVRVPGLAAWLAGIAPRAAAGTRDRRRHHRPADQAAEPHLAGRGQGHRRAVVPGRRRPRAGPAPRGSRDFQGNRGPSGPA